MSWRGSISRSFASTARVSAFRSSTLASAARRLRPPSAASSRRAFSFSNPRTLGELGCTQSLMPLHSMMVGSWLTANLANNLRACCELSHGTYRRSCQDR